jgi:ClpP class serine protease
LIGWAAIEAKGDLKQVQLARLLNDFHKMTKELRPELQSGHSFRTKSFVQLVQAGTQLLKQEATLVDFGRQE